MSILYIFTAYVMERGIYIYIIIYCITYVCILFIMSYIVYALELLKQLCSGHIKVHLLYDVACTLQRHLKVPLQV